MFVQEVGYSYVEMNASCTRSKNSLKEVVAESLNNTSIKNFYTGNGSHHPTMFMSFSSSAVRIQRLQTLFDAFA